MAKDKGQRTKDKFIWLFFAILIIAAFFTGLNIPLVGPDEPRYAQVAREMFERHDWVTPTLGGFDWFEKPALLYWLEIASYKIFGVTEFAARLGSALFGLGTIFALWILGKSVQSNEEKTKTDFAGWLALIAASSIGLIVFSHGASFDIILTFPITASLVSFFIFDLTQKRKDRKVEIEIKNENLSASPRLRVALSLFFFYFFIGVALIAKGLVGIVFPFAIVAFYYLLQKKFPSKTFLFSLVWGMISSLLVAAVWYIPMYQANGSKFINEFFIQHHFQRYTSNKYQHPNPFYFFLWVLPLMTIPWLPFFIIAIWKSIKNLIENFKDQETKKLETQNSKLKTFAWAWLLVPLVFFSFSGSKLPGYILPALPAALILTAQYVYEFVQKSRTRKILVQTTAALTFIIVALLAQFFIHDFLHEETVKHLVDTANANGYKTEKILSMHTISHSAEFYGAGRLVRDSEGKQKRFYGVSQILEEMKAENSEQVLVLIPLEYLYTLKENNEVETRVLDDNGELAIALVKKKISNVSRPPEPIHQS